MAQLSERESQLSYLVTAGEMMQKLTPIRLATLSHLANDDMKAQNEIADALGVSPTTITTHLQLLSDLPRPLTIRKRRYEITSDGDAVIELYSSILRRFDEDFDLDDLSDEDRREKAGEYFSPLHKTRSIAPFLVLYSVGQHSMYRESPDNLPSGATAQFKTVLDDVKRWEEERGKTTSRKQVREILNRFGEFDVVDLAGDWITLLDKGEEHIRLLEGVLELLGADHVAESETSSVPSQQPTSDRLTRSDTGGISNSSVRSSDHRETGRRRQSQSEDAIDSALPAIVPAYQVVSNDEDAQSQSSAPVFPLTSTSVEDMAEKIERISQEHGNARLKLVWTNLRSETDKTETASDTRLKSQ